MSGGASIERSNGMYPPSFFDDFSSMKSEGWMDSFPPPFNEK